jgi:hypothetical protein
MATENYTIVANEIYIVKPSPPLLVAGTLDPPFFLWYIKYNREVGETPKW